MAVGYDATDPSSIPASVPPPNFAIGYRDGAYRSYDSMVLRFPTATPVSLSAIPNSVQSAGCIGCDGERFDYSPQQSAQFCKNKLAFGVVPLSYCSLSTWPDYKAACTAIGVPPSLVDWWIAAYPGNGPVLYPGSIGHQYVDHGSYDESVFSDLWVPGRPLNAPPTNSTPETAMPCSPSILYGFSQHVFQVSEDVLWHKWFAGKWYNEAVAGPMGGASTAIVTLPDQTPQADVVQNQLTVVVEDVNRKAYYFAQSLGGGWGVNALP